jgi:hypothetical protein
MTTFARYHAEPELSKAEHTLYWQDMLDDIEQSKRTSVWPKVAPANKEPPAQPKRSDARSYDAPEPRFLPQKGLGEQCKEAKSNLRKLAASFKETGKTHLTEVADLIDELLKTDRPAAIVNIEKDIIEAFETSLIKTPSEAKSTYQLLNAYFTSCKVVASVTPGAMNETKSTATGAKSYGETFASYIPGAATAAWAFKAGWKKLFGPGTTQPSADSGKGKEETGSSWPTAAEKARRDEEEANARQEAAAEEALREATEKARQEKEAREQASYEEYRSELAEALRQARLKEEKEKADRADARRREENVAKGKTRREEKVDEAAEQARRKAAAAAASLKFSMPLDELEKVDDATIFAYANLKEAGITGNADSVEKTATHTSANMVYYKLTKSTGKVAGGISVYAPTGLVRYFPGPEFERLVYAAENDVSGPRRRK